MPPIGLCLSTVEALGLYGLTSTGTRAWRVACRGRWGEVGPARLAPLPTWVITLAHGPATQSRRTQGMRRIVEVAPLPGLTVRLAASPPSPRQYHPIARGWGIRAHHGNGALLDSLEAVIRLATPMTWQGQWPVGARVTTT